MQVDILHLCRAFYLDDVPLVLADRVEHICTGKSILIPECRFKERLPNFDCF